MEWIVDLFTSGGVGAITGLVGGWLAKREARKSLELQYNHEQQMAKYQAAEARYEREQALALGEQNQRLVELEGQQRIESKTVDAFAASIQSQGKSTGNPILDFSLRLVRPLITFWLLWMMYGIYDKLEQITGGLQQLPLDKQFELYSSITGAIIFLATTATGWWFASRRGQVGFKK